MNLTELNDDVLWKIYGYLDQKSSISLTVSCKRCYRYGLSFGYLKILRFSRSESYVKALKLLEKNRRSVEKIIVKGIRDPELWIEHFAKEMVFYHCKISVLDPPFITKTEVLRIRQKRRCKVNRNKFPKLRQILYV